jgi:hypothetical protein
MTEYTNDQLLNPASGDVLADSDARPAGATLGSLVVASDVATSVRLEWRDAANATTLRSQVVFVAANTAQSVTIPPGAGNLSLNAGERLRLVMAAAAVGNVQGSLFLG